MDISSAADCFAALAQETRLRAFRLLVESEPDGLSAGSIAETLGTPHNTLSSHLAILGRARLVLSRREGRSVIYRVDFDGVQTLLTYLMQDCCRGRPEDCASMLDAILPPRTADA